MNIPGLGEKLIKDLIKQASLTHRLLYSCWCCLFFFLSLSVFYYFLGTSIVVLKIIWDWDRMMCDVRKLERNIFTVLAHVPCIFEADSLIWIAYHSRSEHILLTSGCLPFPSPKARMSEELKGPTLAVVFILIRLNISGGFQQEQAHQV